MIGIVKGTNGVVPCCPPGAAASLHAPWTGRALCAWIGNVFVVVPFVFRPSRFGVRLGQRPSVTSHSFARIQP